MLLENTKSQNTKFPRAILHIDGDSFFASCEVAKNPKLRGKPVVTGKERGIASSVSYEARARGVKRSMRLSEIRKICPDVIILSSDYETYSIYSRRMYNIVRRYTDIVDEYSIDECFADLTHIDKLKKMSYEDMADSIRKDLSTELGMTFSVGLSVNKVIAKVASKWSKPYGLTIIPLDEVNTYIDKIPVGKIWGIGYSTSARITKFIQPSTSSGFVSALDFAKKDEVWVKEHFSKPIQEIYRELNGVFVYELTTGTKDSYDSISKTKTFTPPSMDRDFVFSQLSKNIENACIKLRRHGLFTNKISFFLKTQEFRYYDMEINLPSYISSPQDIVKVIKDKFYNVYRNNVLYRATGIVLMGLDRDRKDSLDLFGNHSHIEDKQDVLKAVDKIDARYGKHTIFLGSSYKAIKRSVHKKHLGIPFLDYL